MPPISLTQGAYQARSLIADAQKCINLYPEKNPEGAAAPATHYTTPGLTATGFVASKPPRWSYYASTGNMYTVVGDKNGASLYVSVPSTTAQGIASTTLIGTFASAGSSPVSMADNGKVLIIVDGSTSGWALDLTNSANFGPITDPNFQGADKVDYLDTFFLFNLPDTFEWYISLSGPTWTQFTGVTGAVLTGDILSPGTASCTNGTYVATSLTGGSGSGAVATITVSSSKVDTVTITTSGTNYLVGDTLSASLPGTAIATGIISTSGSGYTNGTYVTQPMTGGSGAGATATIQVVGNAVTSVLFTNGNPGIGYVAGDVLSAAIPGGSGFQYTVNTVLGNGFSYSIVTTGGVAFDPLDFATKTGYPDPIVGLIVMDLYIWLLGTQTTEIWFNAGAADFPFQIFPGVFIEHGCAAQYSLAKQDLSIYWVSQDKQGQCIVLKGNNFAAHRISTFAIENEFSSYSTISDAIGWTYQQLGHTFYVLTFPTADKTWVFDEATGLWHERLSLQFYEAGALTTDGNLHKVLYHNTAAVCGGLLYGMDDGGIQYQLDPNNYTENGFEIPRIRSFPHLLQNMDRVTYKRFIADMECGTEDPTVTGETSPPMVNLRWSDDRGKTYSSYVQQSLGALGSYLTNIQWRRLGLARDRVFELSWSVNMKTSLQGAYVETEKTGT